MSRVLDDAERFFYETNGYLVVEGALAPDELTAVRAAADAAEARWQRRPELPGTRITEFEEIEGILEYDPLFLDVVENPRVLPRIREVLGTDLQLIDHAYYVTPPGGALDGSAWHTDVKTRVKGIYHPGSVMMVRAMYALEDIPADGGATLVLPGSHRWPDDFPVPRVATPEEMPGAVALTVRAGDAYFFNGALLHAPSHNRSTTTRRVLLFNYGHRWMRMWKGHEPSAWLQGHATTPIRRQLLGLHRPYFGPDAPYEAPELRQVR